MEAPDNIYLFRNPIGVILDSWYLNPNALFEKIEYIRKDAFIERVCEFLSKPSNYNEGFTTIAKYFYELGLKAKEE